MEEKVTKVAQNRALNVNINSSIRHPGGLNFTVREHYAVDVQALNGVFLKMLTPKMNVVVI